jgi:hypothetical protein
MSWSLQLRNGDLALDGARFGQVSGAQKLVQDLRCAILEPRGHDDQHPRFGSLIDGGLDDYGNYVSSVIGAHDWDRTLLVIQTEISRMIAEHQARQIERSKRDRLTYGESTLSPGELLVSLEDIEMQQAQDRLLVTVHLRNGDGSLSALDIPIDTTTAI